jgi:hypothetical protein
MHSFPSRLGKETHPARREIHIKPATSCIRECDFAVFGEPGSVAKGLQDVPALEVGMVGEKFFNRVPGTDLAHEHADRDAHAANARFAPHNGRVLGDAVKVNHHDRFSSGLAIKSQL